MLRKSRPPHKFAAIGVACLLLSAGPAAPLARLQRETPSAQAIEDSLRRSLEILQTDGQAWMDGRVPIQDGQACVSCHQVPFGLWGLKEAERAGIVLDAERSAGLTRQTMAFIARPRKARAMSWGPPGPCRRRHFTGHRFLGLHDRRTASAGPLASQGPVSRATSRARRDQRRRDPLDDAFGADRAWATIGLARHLEASHSRQLERLSQRVTISLLGAPMETVAAYFAARLGANLDLDPELESALITIELDDQPMSLGLDAVCDQSSCKWRIEAATGKPRLQIVRRGAL